MSRLAGWAHEAELLQIVRQCCERGDISPQEFDRLIAVTREPPPGGEPALREVVGLVRIAHAAVMEGWGVRGRGLQQ